MFQPTNPLTPAAPSGQDAQTAHSPNGAAVASASAAGAPGSQTPDPQAPPAYITLEQLQELEEKRNRWLQSTLNKIEGRLERKLGGSQEQRLLETLAKQGITVPEGKQQEMLTALRQRGVLPAEESSEPGEPASDEPPAGDVDPVTQAGMLLAQQWGLQLTDPEIKLIGGATPEQYLRSIALAGQARAQRLGQSGQTTAQPNAAAMPGLTPAGGATSRNPIEKIESAGTLYEMGAQQFRKQINGGR